MKNKGFTIAELTLAFLIIGFLTTILIKNLNNVFFASEKMKAKNTYQQIKNNLSAVIENPLYYSVNSNLSDLSEVKEEDLNSTNKANKYVIYSGERKFREIFAHEMQNNIKSLATCEALIGGEPQSMDDCYVLDNDSVVAIPNTDFINKNMMKVKNPSGAIVKILPIVMYLSEKDILVSNSLNSRGLLLGIRVDGSIFFFNNVDCSIIGNGNYKQCKMIEYLTE